MSGEWTHPVRRRLTAGETVTAITLVTPGVETAAQAATLGFDILWVEMEHSPIGLERLRLIVLASRGLPACVFARVPTVELWTAKRVLDQGVSGVIFPFVSSAAQAGTAADACRYPPVGKRGSGAGLATLTWPGPGAYYDSADLNVLSVAVIENREGLDAVDRIAATPGIDIVFIGTSDLAFSLGHRENSDAKEVRSAIERIVEAARGNGKYLGRPAPDPARVPEWRAMGFQFFQAGTELGFMAAGAARWLEPLGIAPRPRELPPY